MTEKNAKEKLVENSDELFKGIVKDFEDQNLHYKPIERIIGSIQDNKTLLNSFYSDRTLITNIIESYEHDRKKFNSFLSSSKLKVKVIKKDKKDKYIIDQNSDISDIGWIIFSELMDYRYGSLKSDLKDDFIRFYFGKKKAARCPMCGQILETKGKNQKGIPNADLDHFIPKSLYPQFALTVDNFIPTCLECNMREKNDSFPFNGLDDLNIILKHINLKPENFCLYYKLRINEKYWIDENESLFLQTFVNQDKFIELYRLDNRFKVVASRCMGTLLQFLKYANIKNIEALEQFIELLSLTNIEERKNNGYPVHDHPNVWQDFLDWVLHSEDVIMSVWEEVKDYTTTMNY